MPPYRSLVAQGQLVECERLLLNELKKRPSDIGLHGEAVRLYHALHEPERAAMHLGRARELLRASKDARPEEPVLLTLAEALDHLEHEDFAAATKLLQPLTGEAHPESPALRLEAITLAARAELGLGNYFRCHKLLDRSEEIPASDSLSIIRLESHLTLAAYHHAKGNRDRAEEAGMHALEMAESGGWDELAVAALGFLADHFLDLAANGDSDGRYGERGRDYHRDAAARLETIADRLSGERRRHYLAHPRRAPRLRAIEPKGGVTSSTTASRLIRTLTEMSELISSMTDLDRLLERVMDIAIQIVGAERGLVVMVDADTDLVDVKVARNLDGQSIVGLQDFSHNVIREAAKGREIVTLDTARDAWLSQQQSVALYSIRSLVCFPLRVSERAIGAVYLDNQKNIKVYGDEDLAFLRAFTNLAAIAIEKARLLGQLRDENVMLKRVASERFGSSNIIGSGPGMERVFRLVEKAMNSAFPVLICGETGTGKEVITKAIHFGSDRKDKPFVAQNCAAIPSELLESEMFGYKRGSFTGAHVDKKGLFEAAHGGTLFLDEIGDLDQGLQAKLLRVLQDGNIRRVGDTSERKVDVRIISATNRDLKAAVDAGTFRLDLYYRLNVIQIDLPPLRERTEDIPLLLHLFLEKTGKQMGKSFKGFTKRALERLRLHSWPGNVRELENVVARAVVFADGDTIDVDSLPPLTSDRLVPTPAAAGPEGAAPAVTAPPVPSEGLRLFQAIRSGHGDFWTLVKQPFLKRDLSRGVVKEVVSFALEQTGGKYTRALAELGLPDDDYRKFMNFLAKFKLKVERA